MKRVILAILALALAAWPAHAQNKSLKPLLPLPTVQPGPSDGVSDGGGQGQPLSNADAAALWQKIINKDLPNDLKYAKALADNAGTLASKQRSACYGALIDANAQANGLNLKNADGSPMAVPDPHVVTGLEQAAELIDNLQPTAPVMSACAAAANTLRLNTLAFVNAIVTGGAIKALTAGILP